MNLPVPAAHNGLEDTFHGFLRPSSSPMTSELWPPMEIIVLASGWARSTPAAMASELLYSVQFSPLGITSLPQPDVPAVATSRKSTQSPSLLSKAASAARGPENTFSTSSRTGLPSSATSASLALTEPMSTPREYFMAELYLNSLAFVRANGFPTLASPARTRGKAPPFM